MDTSKIERKKMKILDAGCGEGDWIEYLLKLKPKELHCIDKSEERIKKLQHKYRQKKFKFFVGNVENLEYPSDYFDFVLCSRVLSYVDVNKTVKELERVTKKGGTISFQLMCFGYYLKQLFRGDIKRIPNFINFFFSSLFNRRLFNNLDNIDSGFQIRRNAKNLIKVKSNILSKFLIFSEYTIEEYRKKEISFKNYEEEIINMYVKGKILDLGCGTGRLYPVLKTKGKYIGVDFVGKSIKSAKMSYPKGKFMEMDAKKLKFKNNSFNVVFSGFNVLDEIDNLEKAVLEVKRVLKPNGLFIFSLHNSLYWKEMIKNYPVKRNNLMITPRKQTIKSAARYFSRHFDLVEIYGHTFSSYPYFVFRKTD